MTEREKIIKAQNLIETFFNGDGNKTNLWFKVRNPALGNVSPMFMIYCGRIDKLLDFIEGSLAGNHP